MRPSRGTGLAAVLGESAMTRRSGVFATVLLAAGWVSACNGSLTNQGDANGGTSGQGGVSGMAGTSSSGGVSGKGGASGQGGVSGQSGSAQRDAEVDTPVDVGIDGDGDGGRTFQDCGVVPPQGIFRWTEGWTIDGWGSASLSSVGGTAKLTLIGSYANGTVGGVNYDLTAVLTGGATVPAGTYTCGVDATATYRTRMGDFPVASCAFTLDEETVPGCYVSRAVGSFTMTVIEPDGGTRNLTDGMFNVGVTQARPAGAP